MPIHNSQIYRERKPSTYHKTLTSLKNQRKPSTYHKTVTSLSNQRKPSTYHKTLTNLENQRKSPTYHKTLASLKNQRKPSTYHKILTNLKNQRKPSTYHKTLTNLENQRKPSTYHRSFTNVENQKFKDRTTRTPLKTVGYVRCCWRVSISCSTSDARRITIATNSVISNEGGKDRIVITTNGTYPWSFVQNCCNNDFNLTTKNPWLSRFLVDSNPL